MSRETQSITIDGESFQYIVQRSTRRRRTIQLQLDPEAGLKVLVPHTMHDDEISKFLIKHSEWIRKHRIDTTDTNKEIDWSNGGTALLRGEAIQIVVQERKTDDIGRDLPPTVLKSLEGDSVTVTIPPGMTHEKKSETVRHWLMEWYRQEAWDHLKSRVEEFGNVMGVKPNQLKLSNAKKRWGSCSGKRSINLNWRLIMLDESLIDYVVVHELAHLIELNHSNAFWQVVEGVIPDHRELRRRLREQSPAALG